ncbi:MAG: DNA polymerase III subunit [Myxococcota bacterium]|nr:DNA polymerase III subunit [Myxococcota bacterium]MDW8360835.1 DNA polymerase III subunit [Myxococcales bacterium]
MKLDAILDQPGAIDALRRALAAGRLAHAHLFVGPSGVGKALAARALAAAVLCPEANPRDGGCGRCGVCRRIVEGLHPDVREVGPREEGHRNIRIEEFRETILPFLRFAPFEGRAAFLVVRDADVALPPEHAQTANALLKNLEEPRPGVYFVLTTERAERVLPTLRSRCSTLHFGRLSPASLERILERHGVQASVRATCVALADGRAERALQLARLGGLDELVGRAAALDAIASDAEPGAIVDAAHAWSEDERRDELLDVLVLYYRDVALAGLGAPPEKFALRPAADTIAQAARRLDPAAAARRALLVERVRHDLARSVNAESALDALLFALGRA